MNIQSLIDILIELKDKGIQDIEIINSKDKSPYNYLKPFSTKLIKDGSNINVKVIFNITEEDPLTYKRLIVTKEFIRDNNNKI